MTSTRTIDLTRLLTYPEPKVRDTALRNLSDSLVQDPAVLSNVFASWDKYGVAQAFPDFTQLSGLSIPSSMIEQCCQMATEYAVGRAVTDPTCRVAGKLLEATVAMPARDLAPWFPQIEKIVRVSKIFFRVDLKLLKRRIELAEMSADELYDRMHGLIPAENESQTEFDRKLEDACWTMQALRAYHPERFDPRNWLSESFEDSQVDVFKFKAVRWSIMAQAAPGLEPDIIPYVVDDRESVHASAIEALVRIGSPRAIALLLMSFPRVCSRAQHWIARALQRVHAPGLSQEISALRKTSADPRLGNALFVAEIVQFDEQHANNLAAALNTVVSDSTILLDDLRVYSLLHEASSPNEITPFKVAYKNFLQSCNDLASSRITKLHRQRRELRRKLGQSALERYRMRDKHNPS